MKMNQQTDIVFYLVCLLVTHGKSAAFSLHTILSPSLLDGILTDVNSKWQVSNLFTSCNATQKSIT